VCKTTKNRGLFFIEKENDPALRKRTPLATNFLKSILKTGASIKKKKVLQINSKCKIREFYKDYEGVLEKEPYTSSTKELQFSEGEDGDEEQPSKDDVFL
jgi:hypothetical protein